MFLFELERRHILCLYAAVRKGFCCRDSWCSDTDVELYSGGTVVEPGPRYRFAEIFVALHATFAYIISQPLNHPIIFDLKIYNFSSP
jgi:hypothetical protein